MSTDVQDDLRGDEDQTGADRISDAKTNQAKSDADTAAYSGGDDRAENGSAGASGSASKGQADASGAGVKLGAGAAGAGGGVGGGAMGAMKTGAAFAVRNRKKFGIGGGISALLISAVLGFMGLSSLRIESMIKNIFQAEFSSVENTMEKRADKIVIRYLFMQLGKEAPQAIYADGTVLGTLYGNWKISKFQDKLMSTRGIKIEPGSSKGRLKITTPGGAASQMTETQFNDFLNKDLNGKDARAFIRQVTRDQTKWYQVYKRHHLRRYMKNAFNIRKWKIFDRSDSKDPTVALDNELQDRAAIAVDTGLDSAIGCVLDGKTSECPSDENKRKFPDGTEPGHAPLPPPAEESGCAAGEKAADCQKRRAAMDSEGKSKNDTLLQKALKTTTTGSKVAALLESKVFSRVLAVGAGIGLLDLLSHIDTGLWDNSFGKLVNTRRQVQYASQFAAWATLSDNHKEGDINGGQFNAANLRLDGSQASAASQVLYSQAQTGGEPIPADNKIGGGSAATATQVSTIYRASPLGIIVHAISVAYKATVGILYTAFSSLIGAVMAHIPLVSDFGAFISQYLLQFMNFILGSVCDGTTRGSQLMNCILAGGEVTANLFARDTIGAPAVSYSQAAIIDSRIAAEDSRRHSLYDKLLSVEYPRSFVNQLALMTPSSPQAAIPATMNYMASMFASPIRFLGAIFGGSFGMNAMAAVDTSFSGQALFRYSDTQLDEPLQLPTKDIAGPPDSSGNLTGPDGIIDAYDCPVVSDSSLPNICLADQATAEAMTSTSTNADDGGLGGTDSVNTGSPVVATGGIAPTGDVKALAIAMLANKNITYWTNNGVNTRDLVVALSEGKPAYTTCANANGAKPEVNPNILKFIIEAAAKTHIMVNAITDKCHNSSTSLHYTGEAVDLDLNSGPLSIIVPIATKYGGTKNSETTHYHFDFPKVTP